MEMFGYFESNQHIDRIYGFLYRHMEFDPKYPKTMDNIVRTMSCIMHLSPKYNLESIEKNGFVPQHQNSIFKYPDRVHFLKGAAPENDIVEIGQKLSYMNRNPKNDGTYILFTLSVDLIPKNVKFVGDIRYEFGICTDSTVPYDVVISQRDMKFRK